jgi:hypothetical protein
MDIRHQYLLNKQKRIIRPCKKFITFVTLNFYNRVWSRVRGIGSPEYSGFGTRGRLKA